MQKKKNAEEEEEEEGEVSGEGDDLRWKDVG